MKATAMVLEKFGAPLKPREFEIPRLSDGEVLIRLTASGICGSDVHIARGEDPRTPLPMIIGHEGVGVVEDICGAKNSLEGEKLSAGDAVIWDRGLPCGECWACVVEKEPALCASRRTYGISVPCSEFPYLNGCYATHLILRKGAHILKIKDKIDHGSLVAASCSGATVAHAFEQVSLRQGASVVVQGPGPLGAFAVDFALAKGAAQVILIGATASRLEICKAMGAAAALDRRATTEEERRQFIFDATAGRGADLVFESTGTVAGVKEGLALVRRGGTYLSAGVAVPEGTVDIDWFDITRRNIRIQCSWVSSASHLVQAVARVLARPEAYAKLVTHRFRLEQANEALAAVADTQAMKVIFNLPECGVTR